MIDDIKLTSIDFLNKPLLPMDNSRNFHLFYVFEGNGILIADSSSFSCGRDNLFLFSHLDIALSQPANRSSLTILHLAFTCSASTMKQKLSHLPVLIPTSPETRKLILELLHEHILKQPFYKDICALYLEQILIPIIIKTARNQQFFFNVNNFIVHTSKQLTDICNFINSHLHEDLSSDTLCALFHLTPRQINRLFLNELHQSTAEYIRNQRLNRARELLCFSSDSITQIAECTGFKSVHYFSRVFKEKEGVSPSEYKKQLNRILKI